MTNKGNISNELHESIANLLGKGVKILYKTLVRTESRGDKVDNRVLILSPYRVFITTNKIPTKIDNGFHLMEIEAIESKKPNHISISLVHEHKPLSLLIGEEGSADGVINLVRALVCAYDDLYPEVPIGSILNKINVPFELYHPNGPRKPTICGNLSPQYAAMCDLCQTPFRPEVAWDIDTIYLAHDIRQLHLKDFDHLDQRDLIPLLLACTHNTWVNGVVGDGVGGGAAWDAAWRAARGLRSLRWRHATLSSTHATRAAAVLTRHPRHTLQSLDLTGNHIEDRGAISLLSAISHNRDGMENLHLSQCGISGKTVNNLAAILTENSNNLHTLTHLDLSNNNLKDDVNALFGFLAQPNVLIHLNLSSTETTLENIWGALLRGCATHLRELLLARNPWAPSKRARDPLPSFRQFHTAALALTLLDFSFCKLPADALKSLLLGLACNESAANIKLNLSGVITSTHHSHVTESCIHGVRALTHLDISETNMELDLGGIVKAIGRNHSITHLALSRLSGKRSYAPHLIQALVQILQESDTTLTHLDLSDCKLKSDLYSLLNALGGARKLQSLDLTGNLAGDAGARLLAKALQSNSTIQTLYIDRNAFSLQGLTDIATALRRSVSVRRVEFPGADACAAGRGAAERVTILWRDLHDHLSRTPRNRLRALALERAWAGSAFGGALAVAADALPPAPLSPALNRAALAAHSTLHQYLQRCVEVFAACGGTNAVAAELISLQDVKDCLEVAEDNLEVLINDAVESLALSTCVNGDATELETRNNSDIILTPVSHSGATPLGGRKSKILRRVRPKSVAEQSGGSSTEMLSLPPLHHEASDGLADLPHQPLQHLARGRPKRAKTRAPSRPVTDQSQDISEGLEEFWRASRSPAGSEDASLLTSRSLRSLRSPSPSHTMYSLTSGDSTPVMIDADVSRSQSSDNVDTNKVSQRPSSSSPPAPSRSTDNVHKLGNGCARVAGKARPWSVAGVNTHACTTGSMIRDEPLPTDDVDT